MTYYQIVCRVCNLLISEIRQWDIEPDRAQVTLSLCSDCSPTAEEPASWHGWDLGEAGA